jgi:LysR family nitrogen assimilation transcriptional regulator
VAQSALSHHISNLEAEFATFLFERKPRGMEPTAAGERLYEHARIILRAMAAAGALLAGLGCAVATKLFVQEQLKAGTLVAREVVEPRLSRTLYLCRLRNRPMTYVMEEMRRLMLALIAEQVGRGAWEATLLI